MNIHRTPYGGRNYSYYSEDPYVTGMSAAAEIKGCQNVNARAVGKHFVLNDQKQTVMVYQSGQTSRRSVKFIWISSVSQHSMVDLNQS